MSGDKPQLKVRLPLLSIVRIKLLNEPSSDFQVPTSSALECFSGSCFALQLIENNNINNAIKNVLKELLIKDTILALDLT